MRLTTLDNLRTHMKLVSCVALLFVSLGCTARLSSTPGDGVRVNAPAPFVITKKVTVRDAKKALCGQEIHRDFVTLPLGEAYALNIDTTWSWFAANEFSVEFNESGALKKVTLNSDPQVDETLTATAKLVKETAGLVSTVAAAGAAAAVREPDLATCGAHKEEVITCVQTAEQWKASPEVCR
jgi:hypothetical protein